MVSKNIQTIHENFPSVKYRLDTFTDNFHLYFDLGLERLSEFMLFLRDNTQCSFKMLTDITAVDHYNTQPRFELIYQLYSLDLNLRAFVHIYPDEQEQVPSLQDIWASADWAEREVFDLMGIYFQNHPDLRRILTWDNFNGHPLRKDYPVEGLQPPEDFDPDDVRVDSAFQDTDSGS